MNLFFTGACNFYDAGLHTGWIYTRCLCACDWIHFWRLKCGRFIDRDMARDEDRYDSSHHVCCDADCCVSYPFRNCMLTSVIENIPLLLTPYILSPASRQKSFQHLEYLEHLPFPQKRVKLDVTIVWMLWRIKQGINATNWIQVKGTHYKCALGWKMLLFEWSKYALAEKKSVKCRLTPSSLGGPFLQETV